MTVQAFDPAFTLPPARTRVLGGGVEVPYVDLGAGQTLVFIHGSLCDYRYWTPQIGPLSALYRCVAPSLSHYWPDPPANAATRFDWSAHVDEVGAFIAGLGDGPVHLVGHSRGGCIALQAALRFPERVRSLTLADPGGPLDRADGTRAPLADAVGQARERAAQLISEGQYDAGLALFVDAVSKPGVWAQSPPAFQSMARDNARTLVLQFADPLPAYSAQAARRIACPTLLIDGEKSPRVFRDNVDALAGWVADARRETIRGASHAMNAAHPGAFNRLLDAFFTKVMYKLTG